MIFHMQIDTMLMKKYWNFREDPYVCIGVGVHSTCLRKPIKRLNEIVWSQLLCRERSDYTVLEDPDRLQIANNLFVYP